LRVKKVGSGSGNGPEVYWRYTGLMRVARDLRAALLLSLLRESAAAHEVCEVTSRQS
jgi:hypothetical protein